MSITPTSRYSHLRTVAKLNQDDSSEITRTTETEVRYLRRAMLFEASTAKSLSIESTTPDVVASHALSLRDEWSKSYWRQMKASLIFRFESMGTQAAVNAVAMLRDGTQSICVNKSLMTSGRRAKAVSVDAFQKVISAVAASGSEYAPLLTSWLFLGGQIGLRPHEWSQAELISATAQEVGDDDETKEGPLPYLRVQNGKCTNERSHGVNRHLNLSGVKKDLVDAIGDFATLMTAAKLAGNYQRYYEGCRKLLFRVNHALHRKNSSKWIQLYSPRHKFSSDAKNVLSNEAVSALMGHAGIKTATEHYGKKMSSTGTLGPRPISAEISRVRETRKAQARQIQSAAQNPQKNGT